MTVLEFLPFILIALVSIISLCAFSIVLYRPKQRPCVSQRYTSNDFDVMDARVVEVIKAKHREGQRLAQAGK